VTAAPTEAGATVLDELNAQGCTRAADVLLLLSVGVRVEAREALAAVRQVRAKTNDLELAGRFVSTLEVFEQRRRTWARERTLPARRIPDTPARSARDRAVRSPRRRPVRRASGAASRDGPDPDPDPDSDSDPDQLAPGVAAGPFGMVAA
jgi:hypothetical protein